MKRLTKNNFSLLLLTLILGASLFGQLWRLQLPIGRVSFYELFLPFFILINLPRISIKNLRQWLKHPLFWLILWLIWTIAITFFQSQWQSLPSLLIEGGVYWARLVLYVTFALSVWMFGKGNNSNQKKIFTLAFLWLLAQAAIGISQYLIFPDTRILQYLGWDDHLSRAFGTLFDPGFFGLFMALGALVLQKSRFARNPFFLVIFLLALALSFSRSSYLAFTCGIIVYAFLEKQRKYLLLIPLFISLLFFIPKDGGGEGQKLTRTASVAARAEVVEFHTQRITLQELVLGRGWYYEKVQNLHWSGIQQQTPEIENRAKGSNNAAGVDISLLHVALSTGFIGLGLFLGFLITLINKVRYDAIALSALTILLAHSFFSLSLFYPWVLLIFPIYLLPSFWVNKSVPTTKAITPRVVKTVKSNQIGLETTRYRSGRSK